MFGDNVPQERAESAKEAARNCDALLVVGSALMTMSAFRLARYHNKINNVFNTYDQDPVIMFVEIFFFHD